MRMLLKTERLAIRHIVADDWKRIRDIWVDFNSSEYAQYDTPHITENANVQARIAKWAAANSGIEHMFFAICLDKTVIGYVAFNIRENGYEIGYGKHSLFSIICWFTAFFCYIIASAINGSVALAALAIVHFFLACRNLQLYMDNKRKQNKNSPT